MGVVPILLVDHVRCVAVTQLCRRTFAVFANRQLSYPFPRDIGGILDLLLLAVKKESCELVCVFVICLQHAFSMITCLRTMLSSTSTVCNGSLESFAFMRPNPISNRYQLCKTDEHLVENFRGKKNKKPAAGDEEVIFEKFNIPVTREVAFRLNDKEWLNDELVNFWMELLKQKNEEEFKAGLIAKKSVFFNSFFFQHLVKRGMYDFESVRRWTEKRGLNIFEFERVFIPVNKSQLHWFLLVIEVSLREIHSFDSLGG
jgi:hypothetical protein